MMRKWIRALALCLCALNLTFVACNSNSDDGDSTPPPAPTHTCEFNQKVTDSLYLKTAATCQTQSQWYYSCECGAKGTIIALDNTVGRVAMNFSFSGIFRRINAPIAPIRVATAPNITSHSGAPVRMFAKTHPTVRPATASGRNRGKIHSISEMRN